MERVRWIDATKGIAIFLVMLSHLSDLSIPVLTWLTYGYVPMFFVMAGVTYHPTSDWKSALYKRTLRIWVPYVFYGLGILTVASLLSHNVSFARGLLGLLYVRYDLYPPGSCCSFGLLSKCYYIAPLWFLPCFYLSYLLMMLQDRMANKWILPLCALALSALSQYKTILLPYSLDTCFIGFLFMRAGYMWKQRTEETEISHRRIYDWLVITLCVFVYWGTGTINGYTNMSLGIFGQIAPWSVLCFLVLGITETLFFALVLRQMNHSFVTRIFSYMGREALRLMCIHIIFGSLFYKVLCYIAIPPIIGLLLATAGVIGINVLIGFLLRYLSPLDKTGLISNL